jgi:Rrf2 family transcriptional regulator, iron-sulfur cluster assembly transcription factor
MKINAMDEYGLRVLIRIGKADQSEGINIPQLSEAEGLSHAYVAKITRLLREQGLVISSRGYKGGYLLARAAQDISISEVLKAIGGTLYDPSFCMSHTGEQKFCSNSVDCSVRSLWRLIQLSVDQLLEEITLEDLLGNESKSTRKLQNIFDKIRHSQEELKMHQ